LLNNYSVKLTERLVKRPRPARAARRRGPAANPDPSRDRLFAAAATAFAAHGFAGTSVDRIADAARLNKAMIYYHFGSKAGLYREILRDMFAAVGARARTVAASDLAPSDKIRAFVDTFAAEAQARPHFPPVWFREVADGGARLDDATLADMAGVLKALAAIVEEGVRAQVFRPVNPLLVHAGIVGPVLLFFASDSIRRRVERLGVRGAATVSQDEVVAHVQRVALALLEGRIP
jgi:AcrR family transcriptional regulator